LAYLNETLNLGLQSHHRAYSDALATSKIFQKSLNNIPNFVKSSDDLVRFAKMSTKEINKLKKKGRLTL
jgi:DNA polymerase-3 subunit epsilon